MSGRSTIKDGQPLISVAMPAFETRPRHLRAAIESVRAQTYPRWELRVVDDGSRSERVRELVGGMAAADPRIRLEVISGNSGISVATNRAVELCSGEFVAFLDHDDKLAPDALEQVAGAIVADPGIDVLYTDQDKLSPRRGRRVAPFRKPDFSPVYALGAMYVGHLLVVRRTLLDAVGGLDPAYDTIQDFELLLRLSEHTDAIHHLPRILYHWRAAPGSIAAGADEKSGVPELQARAVTEHLRRRGVPVSAEPHPEIPHRTRLVRDASAPSPQVSVIAAPAAGVQYPGAALNRAAAGAPGEYVVFVGAGVDTPDSGWIQVLLACAALPAVGIVGPLLLDPGRRVLGAGLGVRRWEGAGRVASWWHGRAPAEPLMRGAPADADGYYGSLSCAREVGAVSAACMLVSADLLRELGGFDEGYRTAYHDVDLCLRAHELGASVVYSPWPRLVHHRPAPQPEDEIDRALFIDNWFDRLDSGDPYLHRMLTPAMQPLGARG